MLNTAHKEKYRAFGLTISSDIYFPELQPIDSGVEYPDVQVKLDVFLKAGYNGTPYDFDVEGHRITILIPDVGVYRIQYGNEIIVSPYVSTDEDMIRLYLLGSCFGALLFQRGYYPLHGSCVAINGRAYAFVGDSGAGKSTLASAFIEKGYPLLSDDVIAVSFVKGNEIPFVIPSYPQQKLWQQSLDAFGVSSEHFRSIYGRVNKFCIPVLENYYSNPLPLGGIFELVKSAKDDVEVSLVSASLARLQKLYKHTYRQYLVSKMELTEWHFNHSSVLASVVPIYQIIRSTKTFTAHHLVDLVLSAITKED